MIINNFKSLISHGNISGRQTVLEMMEAGFAATDPYKNTRALIKLDGNKLIIGRKNFPFQGTDSKIFGFEPLVFDLSQIGNIYVTGGGKAAQRMALAIEDVLGDRITAGHICAKKGESIELKRIGLTLAGHPIPDKDSVEGAKRIMEIELNAKQDDIVFNLLSGGGTALMTLPGPGLTLDDIKNVTQKLYFEQGASIMDANAVRSQLVILRGRHGRNVGDATRIEFSTSPYPTVLRNKGYIRKKHGGRGYKGAIEVLKKHRLWDEVSQSIRDYLLKKDPKYGSIRPDELKGKPQFRFIVIESGDMLEAAKRQGEKMGINTVIIASSPEDIEARAYGKSLSLIAIEEEVYKRPFNLPCAIIAGGELLVSTRNTTGIGGRNQEFALSTAPKIEGSLQIVVASADSDGADGPTNVAGGIVDGLTIARAEELGINIFDELDNHNSFEVFDKLGDHIITGTRGTNVQDLRILYIGEI
jgi:glycerate-2-kinase